MFPKKLDVLERVIGKVDAHRLYKGRLSDIKHPKIDDAMVLATLILGEQLPKRITAEDSYAVKKYLRTIMRRQEHESVYIIFLDAGNEIIAMEEMFRGTIDCCHVHVREVAKAALLKNAKGIVVVHNHPQSEPDPSESDEKQTQQLMQALELFDIALIDHWIIGGPNVTSFRERGLL